MSMANESPAQEHSNPYTVSFILILCTICAFILAAMASGLKNHQQAAIELDRSREMLMAAHVLDTQGYFQVKEGSGWQKASLNDKGVLVANEWAKKASAEEIIQFYNTYVHAVFTDERGKLYLPQKLDIDPKDYFNEHQKYGFAHQPKKLLYVVLAQGAYDPLQGPYEGFIIPINGFGLWGPIYGYLGLEKDAMTALGISWYQHSETPGLGANISDPSWQKQFPGKIIYQKDTAGNMDPFTSAMGIVVIKGRVNEVYGNGTKADNSVDGITGATITGNGVSAAHKDVLEQYRPFLIQVSQAHRGSYE